MFENFKEHSPKGTTNIKGASFADDSMWPTITGDLLSKKQELVKVTEMLCYPTFLLDWTETNRMIWTIQSEQPHWSSSRVTEPRHWVKPLNWDEPIAKACAGVCWDGFFAPEYLI